MAFFDKIEVPKSYHLLDTPKKFSWVIDRLLSSPEFSYDIETTHATLSNKDIQREYNKGGNVKIAGIAFSWGRSGYNGKWSYGNAAYLPLITKDEFPFWGRHQDSVIKYLRMVLESDIPKVAHNGKFDSRELFRRLGIRTKNLAFDTMLAHALIDEEGVECSHALKSDFSKDGKIIKLGISDKFIDTGSSVFKKDLGDALLHFDKDYRRYHKVPLDTLYPYACADADLTLTLRFILAELLEKENLRWVFDNVTMPLSHAIMLLEIHGVPLNINQARRVEREQKEIMDKSALEVQRLVGKEFNVGSPAQLGAVLYEDLGLEGGEKNKNGWSVDAEAIERLNHPVKVPLAEYRRAQQIQSTYATPALELMEEITDGGKIGWVHPNIFLDAVTGRLKCKDPNLTNLPRAKNGGEIVKGMWEGSEDYRFVFADFSQMELRVTAHCSQEPSWMGGFIRDEDMHAATAKAVFNLDCAVEEVDKLFPNQRSYAKSINFGILYGESIYALSQKLGISYEEAEKLVMVDYFGAAPVLKSWIDFVHDFASQNGYVLNMFNRRRHLPDAMIVPPEGVQKPKFEDRPECYAKGPRLYDLDVLPEDLYNVDDAKISQLIKERKLTKNFKCMSCPFRQSCFVNSEVRYQVQKKNRALRQSVNSIIQGSAADMSSTSLIWITDELRRNSLRSAPILYIHDEIGCYCHVQDVEATLKIMDDCMVDRLVKYTGFSIPLKTDAKVVKCWGDKDKK